MNPDPNQNNNQSSVPQNSSSNQNNQTPPTNSIVPELRNETPMSLEPVNLEPVQPKIPDNIFTNTINPSALDISEKSENPNPQSVPVQNQVFEKNEYKPQTTSFLSQPDLKINKEITPISNLTTSSIAPNPISTPTPAAVPAPALETIASETSEKTNEITPEPKITSEVNHNPVEDLFKTPSPTTPASAPTTPSQPSITQSNSNINRMTKSSSPVNKQTLILLGAGILGVLIVSVGILLIANITQPSTPNNVVIPQENLVRETEIAPTPTPTVSKVSNQDYAIISSEVNSAIKQITTNYPLNLSDQNINKENVRTAANQILSQDEKLRVLDLASADSASLNNTITTDLKEFANLHDEIYLILNQNQQITLQKKNELQAKYNNLKLKIEANLSKVTQ